MGGGGGEACARAILSATCPATVLRCKSKDALPCVIAS